MGFFVVNTQVSVINIAGRGLGRIIRYLSKCQIVQYLTIFQGIAGMRKGPTLAKIGSGGEECQKMAFKLLIMQILYQ